MVPPGRKGKNNPLRRMVPDGYLVFPRRSVLDREERALARLRSLASRFAAEAGAGSQKTD